MFKIELPDEITERLHTIYNHPHINDEEEVQLAEDIAGILHTQENE